ncbi:MAG: hypothetical protein J0H17_18740 [Rhizobiales bacterium]|nr:hypothetical protein [Hyphomicrobiales bacterium]
MITTTVEPLNLTIAEIINEDLSPAAQSRMLADAARGHLKEAQEINRHALGEVPEHVTYVDGAEGAALEQVRPQGTIVFEFDIVLEAFAWVDQMLREHSPVRSGRYQRSHLFFADDEEADPRNPPPGAERFVFVNTQPYARKIERGLSPQAPNGVYEGVAAMASKRFGNVAKFYFTYEAPLTGAVLDWAHGRKLGSMPASKRRRQLHKDVRNPAILIRVR